MGGSRSFSEFYSLHHIIIRIGNTGHFGQISEKYSKKYSRPCFLGKAYPHFSRISHMEKSRQNHGKNVAKERKKRISLLRRCMKSAFNLLACYLLLLQVSCEFSSETVDFQHFSYLLVTCTMSLIILVRQRLRVILSVYPDDFMCSQLPVIGFFLRLEESPLIDRQT